MAFVSGGANGGGGISSTSVNTLGVSTGDIIIAETNFAAGSDNAPTDSQGNTYTKAYTSTTAAIPGNGHSLWWTVATATGTVNVSVASGATTRHGLAVHIHSGLDATPDENIEVSGTGTGNSVASGNVTTTTANSLLVGALSASGGYSGFTPTNSFANGQSNTAGRVWISAKYTTGTVTDGFTATMTGGAALTFHATTSTYQPAGATSYTLASDSGSFTITGTAASLEYSRVVAADAGSFAVTGTSASLEYNREINADSGTFTITGADATLTYQQNETDYSLAADSGSFAFTGTSASLEYNRAVSADAGSFTVTGADASLVRNRLLSAEGASYVVSGTAAGVRYSRVITMLPAIYFITGADATLDYSGEAVVTSYSYSYDQASALAYAMTHESDKAYTMRHNSVLVYAFIHNSHSVSS